VPVQPFQPGVLSFPDQRLIAHDENFAIIGQNGKARRGRPIVIYLVGMGLTTPGIGAGAISPGQPLAETAAMPEVLIDGKPVRVLLKSRPTCSPAT
jgi:uncharacterized protein (TIGR03437 family)